MAGWSEIADGSALQCCKTLEKLRTNECWFDLEQDKLRCLFDQFVSICLKEICGTRCLRPLPPMLGDGKSVDLFKLYSVVREKGGYEAVCKNAMWDLVAKDSGMDSVAASAVKLIYIKYLYTLDKKLETFLKNKGSKVGLQESGMDGSEFSMDLESGFKEFLSEVSHQEKKDEEYLHLELEESELTFMGVKNMGKGEEGLVFVESNGGMENAGDRKSVDDEKHNVNLESRIGEEDGSNRKRKRECHSEMLAWVKEVAKDPCDLDIGSLPERSKWKSYGTDQLWKRVLLAREAMLLKRDVDSSAEQSIWQKKQKMHPTMYEDHSGSERSRCSQRILSAKESLALLYLKKSRARACSESSSSTTHSDLEDHFDLWGNNQSRKRIPVGPYFQANLPEWSGETYESDSKWLGTRVWPLEKRENTNHVIERDRIGKGRHDFCGCELRGSIECVRFHIAEKRMRVKLELCSAFQRWKFDKMGEEVALSWTREEEKKFQDTVKLNPPSLDKCFWHEMLKSFPIKSRGELVSYYFNVFLVQRRCFQNRCTPNNIDSDDDEPEGSVTNGVGHGGSKPPGSILCSPKKVHLNFR